MDKETGDTKESGADGARQRLRQKVEDFEKTIRAGLQDVEQNVRDAMRKVVNEDVADHLSNSKREFLMAIKGMVDGELNKMDKTPPGKEKVKRD